MRPFKLHNLKLGKETYNNAVFLQKIITTLTDNDNEYTMLLFLAK